METMTVPAFGSSLSSFCFSAVVEAPGVTVTVPVTPAVAEEIAAIVADAMTTVAERLRKWGAERPSFMLE